MAGPQFKPDFKGENFWLNAKQSVRPYVFASNDNVYFVFLTNESAKAFASWASKQLNKTIDLESKRIQMAANDSQILRKTSEKNHPKY